MSTGDKKSCRSYIEKIVWANLGNKEEKWEDEGCGVLDTGGWILEGGCSILDARYWMQMYLLYLLQVAGNEPVIVYRFGFGFVMHTDCLAKLIAVLDILVGEFFSERQ